MISVVSLASSILGGGAEFTFSRFSGRISFARRETVIGGTVKLALTVAQIVLSLLLATTILLQQRGSGLGDAFGGSGGSVYRSKRGLEKTLHQLTITLATLFAAVAIATIFVHS